MLFLGFEGLLIAKAVAIAAAKVATDIVVEEERNNASGHRQAGPQPYPYAQPPARQQPHYAAQLNAYDPREVHLQRGPRGLFYARTEIDGRHATMMVDTGATGVAIGHRLARQLGFDLRSARYDTRVRTGGGIVMACRFTLPHILVEGLPGWNVDAIVHERETATDEVCDGLIGGSFLRQIIVEQHDDTLILRPKG